MEDLEILAEELRKTQASIRNIKTELQAIYDSTAPLEVRFIDLKEEEFKLRKELAKRIKNSGLAKIEYMNKKYGIRETERVYISDSDKVMAWIKAQKNIVNKQYIRVEEKLNVAKFKKFALLKIKSGEKIPETKIDTELTLVVK